MQVGKKNSAFGTKCLSNDETYDCFSVLEVELKEHNKIRHEKLMQTKYRRFQYKNISGYIPKIYNKSKRKAFPKATENPLSELLDLDYVIKPGDRCIFSVPLNKLVFWIEAIDVQYYEYIGSLEEFEVSWDGPHETREDTIQLEIKKITKNGKVLTKPALVILIHLNVGFITCHGTEVNGWCQKDFPFLCKYVQNLCDIKPPAKKVYNTKGEVLYTHELSEKSHKISGKDSSKLLNDPVKEFADGINQVFEQYSDIKSLEDSSNVKSEILVSEESITFFSTPENSTNNQILDTQENIAIIPTTENYSMDNITFRVISKEKKNEEVKTIGLEHLGELKHKNA